MKVKTISCPDELLELQETGSVCVIFDTKAKAPVFSSTDFDLLLYVQINSENAHIFQVCRVPQIRVYQNGTELYSHVGDDYNNVLLNFR